MKIKKINLLLVCILCLFIFGCGYVMQNTPVEIAPGIEMNTGNAIMFDIVKRNIDAFSPREIDRLENANNKMCIIKEKINNIIRQQYGSNTEFGSGFQMECVPQVISLYQKARRICMEVRTILFYRMQDLPKKDQELFNEYNDVFIVIRFN